MVRLYYYPGNASLLPHMMLREAGAPLELVLVDRTKDAHHAPEYLRLNPNGLIPVLSDGDVVLYETAAIAFYLAEKHPEAGLAPAPGSARRPDFLRWMVHLTNTPQAVAARRHVQRGGPVAVHGGAVGADDAAAARDGRGAAGPCGTGAGAAGGAGGNGSGRTERTVLLTTGPLPPGRRGRKGHRTRFSTRSVTTPGSARVLVSPRPSVSLAAILRRMRRMILPLRVFGRPGAHWMASGAAIGPISRRTQVISSLRRSSVGSSPLIKVT